MSRWKLRHCELRAIRTYKIRILEYDPHMVHNTVLSFRLADIGIFIFYVSLYCKVIEYASELSLLVMIYKILGSYYQL